MYTYTIYIQKYVKSFFKWKNKCRVKGWSQQLTMAGNTAPYLWGWTSAFTVSLWLGETPSPFLEGCAFFWISSCEKS